MKYMIPQLNKYLGYLNVDIWREPTQQEYESLPDIQGNAQGRDFSIGSD